MEANLSIVLVVEDNNLDHLIQIFRECFQKHFRKSEFVVCCSAESKKIKNFLASIKDLNVRTFQSSEYQDRLDQTYKMAINHTTRRYILFFPHHMYYLFNPLPRNIESIAKSSEICIFKGKNFNSSELILVKRDVFKKINFPSGKNFIPLFLVLAKRNFSPAKVQVDWHSYREERSIDQDDVTKFPPIDSTPPTIPARQKPVVMQKSKNPRVLVVTNDPYPIESQYCPPSYSQKAKRTTAPGLRAWSIIQYLHSQGVDVSVGCTAASYFVPSKDYKVPIVHIDKININSYTTAILYTGDVHIDNVFLKYRGNLILDCWVPTLVEFPLALMRTNSHRVNTFQQTWKQISSQLFRTANYYIYPHERTLGIILGTAATIGNLGISEMISTDRFLHIPYCAPVSNKLDFPEKKKELFFTAYPWARERTTFGWFGGNYPWFDFNKVLDAYAEIENQVDGTTLVLKSFNNYKGLTTGEFSKERFTSVIVDNNWVSQEEKHEYVTDIDYFMIFGEVGFEGKFANRTRILDLCSLGCIVITDKTDVIGQIAEKYGLAYLVDKNNSSEIAELAKYLTENKKKVQMKKDIEGFRDQFSVNKWYPSLLGAIK